MARSEFTIRELVPGEPVRLSVEASTAEIAKMVELWIRTAAVSDLETAHLLRELECESACRVCGCTEALACAGGCFWVEPDLCSACAAKGETHVYRGEVALTLRGTAHVSIRASSVEDARARLASGSGVELDWDDWITAAEREMEPVADVEEVAA